MNKKQEMSARIKKHGKNLNNMFGLNEEPLALCRKLLRLENKAHALSLAWCNGRIESNQWENKTDKILEKVNKILNPENVGLKIIVNGDARGYALKIEFDDTDVRRYEIHRDMGGNGIVAPDLRGA